MINATTSTTNLQRELDRLWRWWSIGLVSDGDALMLSEVIEAELHVARSRCRRTHGSSRARPTPTLDAGAWSKGPDR